MQLASFHATRYLINQVRTDAPKTLTAGGGGGEVFLVLTVHRFAPMHPNTHCGGGGGGVPGFNSAQVRTDAPKTLTAGGGGGGVPGFNSAQVRTDAPKHSLRGGGGGGGVFLVLTVHRFAPMHPKHSLRGGGGGGCSWF